MKRFDVYETVDGRILQGESESGEYVTYDTAAKLAEQVEALKAENECLRDALEPARLDAQVEGLVIILDSKEKLARAYRWMSASKRQTIVLAILTYEKDLTEKQRRQRTKLGTKLAYVEQKAAQLYKEAMEG